jgi:hypothetical protein
LIEFSRNQTAQHNKNRKVERESIISFPKIRKNTLPEILQEGLNYISENQKEKY